MPRGTQSLGRYEHGTLTEQTILARPNKSKRKNDNSAEGVTFGGYNNLRPPSPFLALLLLARSSTSPPSLRWLTSMPSRFLPILRLALLSLTR